MMFARISCLDDLLPHIQDKPEIRVMVQPNGCTVVCYMISNENTFNGENKEFARECRGITFDRHGKILARPFHKFFNVNEREETQEHMMPWDDVYRIMDKRDGSMITPVIVDGQLVCKSKKSFESDVAIAATEFIHLPENRQIADYARMMCELGYTTIYEFTSPQHRIVLPYAERKLTLLNVRDNVTGEYEKDFDYELNIPVVDFCCEFQAYDPVKLSVFNKDLMKAALETREHVEGWVIQFMSGQMAKWKTKWYMALHHTVVFRSERAIAEMVIDEVIDDMKTAMKEIGANMDRINAIEQRVVNHVNELSETVEAATSAFKHLCRKDFAISQRHHPLFALMIKHYTGQEPDYAGHFKKYFLKEFYSLEQI